MDDPLLYWVSPKHRASPTEALPRVEAICRLVPDLYAAMSTVQATHQGLSRDLLAAAILQYRADAAGLTQRDVAGLLTSIWTGGREGFEAVMRAKKKGERRAGALPWASD